MAQNAAITARISADGSDFLSNLNRLDVAAKAWAARQVQTARAATAAVTATGADGPTGRFKNAGFASSLLEISRAAEDAQYGLRGIMNNIPSIAFSLGAGAGLAGAASLAAVAIATLGQKLFDFATNAKGIKEAADQVDKLDLKLKALSTQGAKDALEGTAKAAKALKEAIAAADAEFKSGNETLTARISLITQIAEAEKAAALAVIAASGATASEKVVQALAVEEKALKQAHETEQARLRDEIDLRTQKVAAIEAVAGAAAIANRKAIEQEQALRKESEARDAQEERQRAIRAAAVKAVSQIPGALEFVEEPGAEGANDAAARHARVTEAQNKRMATARDAAQAAAQAAQARAEADQENARAAAQLQANEKQTAAEINALKLKGTTDLEKANLAQFEREIDQADSRKKAADAELELQSRQLDKVQQLQAAYDREAAALRKVNAEHQANLQAIEAQNRIKNLREQNRDTQADREERDQRIKQRTEEIQRQTGVTPTHARLLAEDEEPGRGRIDARPRQHRQAGGLDERDRGFPGLDAVPARTPPLPPAAPPRSPSVTPPPQAGDRSFLPETRTRRPSGTGDLHDRLGPETPPRRRPSSLQEEIRDHIGEIGGPTPRKKSRTPSSTEQIQEAPRANGIGSGIEKMVDLLKEIKANTEGQRKGKSEPLKRE